MSRTLRRSLGVLGIGGSLALAGYLLGKTSGGSSKIPCLARRSNVSSPRVENPNVLPGGRPEDGALAQSNPDEYAWRLFLALNRQALEGKRGLPDPNRPTIGEYQDDKPVIWETWALASGGRSGKHGLPPKNTSEVFKDLGRTPDPWDQLDREEKSLEQFTSKLFAGISELVDSKTASELKSTGSSSKEVQNVLERTEVAPLFIEPSPNEEAQGIGEEVRMNRATFEHVVANNLYNIEGLEEAFRKFRDSPDPSNPVKIDLPAASQEIKAKWVRIREEDKPRYHWRQLKGKDGDIQIWGLTALHIITKDLKDWFWSDFEHIDYLALPVHSVGLNYGSDIGDKGEIESRDTTTRTAEKHSPDHAATDCQGNIIEGMRSETAGTKWENYRLRGTQTTFTCVDLYRCENTPTVLANTQIERGFQQSSSCITCHSRATIGERGDTNLNYYPNHLDVFLSVHQVRPTGWLLVGPIGEKKEEWFRDEKTKKLLYAQTDYMWSLSERALSTKVTTPDRPIRMPCTEPCPVPSPSIPGP